LQPAARGAHLRAVTIADVGATLKDEVPAELLEATVEWVIERSG
jgi:hypothetical protein